jgi:SAM-dependent methyltransferase
VTTTYDADGAVRSTDPPEHPAKFSRAILARLREMLAPERDRVGSLKILDPFAGVGGIHELAEEKIATFGVELQPEWAAVHEDTICGSVLELPSIFPAGTFDAIVTSPCYGNRMADHHDARERCSSCDGRGAIESYAEGLGPWNETCEACDGKGVRDHTRNTYAHKLRESGAEPVASDDNAQLMQWGPRYRAFHEEAWRACHRVLRPGGLVLLNVKNHLRTVRGRQSVQAVVEFHLNTWLLLGYTIEEARRVETKGLAYGANHDVRTPAELVLALRRPET